MDSGDFTDLARKSAFDKASREKAFKIGSNSQYDGYQKRLTSMVLKGVERVLKVLKEVLKGSKGSKATTKSEIEPNQDS